MGQKWEETVMVLWSTSVLPEVLLDDEPCGLKQVHSRNYFNKVDVHGSMHRNIHFIERTNKMQPCSRIYYSSVS
jgi:hypothetical protein